MNKFTTEYWRSFTTRKKDEGNFDQTKIAQAFVLLLEKVQLISIN